MSISKLITTIGVTIISLVTGVALIEKNNVEEVSSLDMSEDKMLVSEGSFVENKEKIVFDKLANATVTSKDASNDLIPSNATFEIDFDKDVSKEYVENAFSIKPFEKLEVTEYSPRHYSLKASGGLEEDQIYNIEEKTTQGTYKWAFQTEKVFRVEYTYPEDKGFITETGTPEIRFNGKLASGTDLSKYITISPNVNGIWKESYSYNYRFEHNNHFDIDKT